MLILSLMEQKPEWFREGLKIASFFGEFPSSLWNGGRPSNYDQCDEGLVKNVIKTINSKLSSSNPSKPNKVKIVNGIYATAK
jgi:hypothetical protein